MADTKRIVDKIRELDPQAKNVYEKLSAFRKGYPALVKEPLHFARTAQRAVRDLYKEDMEFWNKKVEEARGL